jgi:hypothetical protein
MSDSKLRFEMTCLVCFVNAVLSNVAKNAKRRPFRNFLFILNKMLKEDHLGFFLFI